MLDGAAIEVRAWDDRCVILQTGICALYRDVLSKIASGMSLRALIYAHAPPNANSTAV